MRAALAIAALALGGCFASWSVTQLSGHPQLLDASDRRISVPLPGVEERLGVRVPLAVPAGDPAFALSCATTQSGRAEVHHWSHRYGKTWKKVAALMFVLEAGAAAAFYFSDRDNPQNQLAAGALAADALGTAVIGFLPRREQFAREVHATGELVREDCPAGLAIAIGDATFPVDAAGRLDEAGAAALDAWLRVPTGLLRLALDGRTADFRDGPDPRELSARLLVPTGTLTGVSATD